MDHTHRTWLLLAKKLTGEATVSDLQDFQQLLEQQPPLRRSLHFFTGFWKPAVIQNENEEEMEIAFSRHLVRMREKVGIIF